MRKLIGFPAIFVVTWIPGTVHRVYEIFAPVPDVLDRIHAIALALQGVLFVLYFHRRRILVALRCAKVSKGGRSRYTSTTVPQPSAFGKPRTQELSRVEGAEVACGMDPIRPPPPGSWECTPHPRARPVPGAAELDGKSASSTFNPLTSAVNESRATHTYGQSSFADSVASLGVDSFPTAGADAASVSSEHALHPDASSNGVGQPSAV